MAAPLTFLFTDLENSTSLWAQAPMRMRGALARHDEILGDAVATHNGRIVKTTGDGIHAVFDSAFDGIYAALSAQQSLNAESWPRETGPLKVRMGLHTGESEARDGDYYGSTVNEAARIMGMGHGGQILISEVTLLMLRGQQLGELSFSEIGEHQLKGLAHSEKIFQLNHPDLAAEFPPLQSPSVEKHNLPAQLTPLVGRQSELAALSRLLLDPNCAFVSIVAPGGMGKSHLARRLGRQMVREFENGVYFVDLTAIVESDDIIPAIAEAVGFQFQQDARSPKRQMIDYLGNKHMLLILDNFEHLLDGAGLVVEMLRSAARLKILVTSRQRLAQPGETLFALAGLELPGLDMAGDASDYAAVELFQQASRRAHSDFDLTPENMPNVVQICRLVEGMPLGILLAAPWISVLSTAEIVDEIQRGFDILEMAGDELPDRQRSMRVVFDQAWNMLATAEQQVFRKMAVFRGGFTRAAAEEIAGAGLRQLQSLVNKGLVERDGSQQRYHVHELLRQYAADKLSRSSAEFRGTRDAHCRYYADFLEQREGPLMGVGQLQAVAEIEEELDNVRAAWHWALENGLISAIKEAAFALGNFYQFQSRYIEGLKAFERAADILHAQPQSADRDLALIDALMVSAWFYLRFGRIVDIEAVMRESRMLHDQLGIRPKAAYMSEPAVLFAFAALIKGEYGVAEAHAKDARQTAAADDNWSNQKFANFLLAQASMAQGQFDDALAYAQEAYGIAAARHDQWFMAYILNTLADLAMIRDAYQTAKKHYEESYAIRQAFNDEEGMAVALNSLSEISLRQEDYAAAEHYLAQSIQLYQEINDKGGLATAYNHLGEVALAQGDLEAAREHLTKALRGAVDIWFVPSLLAIMNSVGVLYCRLGHIQEGVTLLLLVKEQDASSQNIKEHAGALIRRFRLQLSAQQMKEARQQAANGDVEAAVENVLVRLPTLDLEAGESIPEKITAQDPNQALVEPLTPRELEVLALMAEGCSNQEIASRLIIAEGTVKYYTGQIYGKLQVRNRIQAVSLAQELDLV